MRLMNKTEPCKLHYTLLKLPKANDNLANQINRTLIIPRMKLGNLDRELSHFCILGCIHRRTPRIYSAKLGGEEVE